MPELVHLVRGFSIEYKVDPKGGAIVSGIEGIIKRSTFTRL